MAKKRLTKRELRHDPVREAINKFLGYFFTGGKKDKVLWGIVIVAIIVIAGIFMSNSGSSRVPEAQVRYLQALTLYARGDTLAYPLFQELAARYRGKDSGKRALFYLGVIEEERGDYDAAESHFREFLHSGVGDPFLVAGAYGHLGSILMVKGRYGEAADHFIKARDIALSKNMKAFYHYKAIIAYKKAGENKKALALLNNFEDLYGDTHFINEVRGEIRILKGTLEVQG